MSKISSISGFPEWLPEQKIIEDRIIALIKAVYVSYGFTPIETPAVELMSTLAAKGVVDKEIYCVSRAQAEPGAEAEIGLHFDLTVPFARYVAQHFNELQFPFKRFQLQKVWRGDRPQRGRFREFFQFDIDIIARENLPLSCDAEIIEVLDRAFRAAAIARHGIKLNNRKLLQGIYRALGLEEEQRKAAITVVDKINKIGKDGVLKELREQLQLDSNVATKILEFAELRVSLADAEKKLPGLVPDDAWCAEGVRDILALKTLLPSEAVDVIEVDFSLARGLDYYTGTILEVHLIDYPNFGSVAAGGRYEDLASQFISKKLPGVGVSIGLTRLMDLVFSEKLIPVQERAPTKVLVAVADDVQRARCNEVARELRALGVSTEVNFTSPKFGKQIDYAAGKKIPHVLFISDSGEIEIKNLVSKEQAKVTSLKAWAEGLKPGI